nr:MAG TPA: hypothetical protein [Caudoviricetes sp.]
MSLTKSFTLHLILVLTSKIINAIYFSPRNKMVLLEIGGDTQFSAILLMGEISQNG